MSSPADTYGELTDEKLELLVLEWMTEELNVPEESAVPLLFILSEAREDNVRCPREKLIEIAENPALVYEKFQEMDEAVSQWLAVYLPELATTQDNTIIVNRLQLYLELSVEEEGYADFLFYLGAHGIIRSVEPHRWGSQFELWKLAPQFVQEFQESWPKAGDTDDLAEQAAARSEYTNALARKLSTYKPTSSTDLLSSYKQAAKELRTDTSVLMDAERLLLRQSDSNTQLRFVGVAKAR